MNAYLINLVRIGDEANRGSLTFVEDGIRVRYVETGGEGALPFTVRRVYWTYDVSSGECRGGHAHKDLTELIIAVSGCFTLRLDDGREKREYVLKNPHQGVLVEKGIWRDLVDFSSGAVCLVLASAEYDEEDYIRDYDEYIKYINNK